MSTSVKIVDKMLGYWETYACAATKYTHGYYYIICSSWNGPNDIMFVGLPTLRYFNNLCTDVDP